MSRFPREQLVHFLSDMYSVEQQALAQLVSAPDIAGDPSIAEDFRRHHTETEQHAALIAGRLEAYGESPSKIKDLVMRVGGKGFLLFAQSQPETPGKLAAHAYSYEAMEWAGYEMLIRFAKAADDVESARVATVIRDQERAMMERLERDFNAAEQASHAGTAGDKLVEDLCKHLGEAHALENQGIQLLTKGSEIAGDGQLSAVCAKNLEISRVHAGLLEKKLRELGTSNSILKDMALGLGGFNWALFFQSQSDTPSKLAAFAYAYEHLKIAGYELLKRTASRTGDTEVVSLCEKILAEEQGMAKSLVETFHSAVRSTLEALQD